MVCCSCGIALSSFGKLCVLWFLGQILVPLCWVPGVPYKSQGIFLKKRSIARWPSARMTHSALPIPYRKTEVPEQERMRQECTEIQLPCAPESGPHLTSPVWDFALHVPGGIGPVPSLPLISKNSLYFQTQGAQWKIKPRAMKEAILINPT